mgnify:CR=1 FL=1
MKRLKRKRKEIRKKQREYKKEKFLILILGILMGIFIYIPINDYFIKSKESLELGSFSDLLLSDIIPSVYFKDVNIIFEKTKPNLFVGLSGKIGEKTEGYYNYNYNRLVIIDIENKNKSIFYEDLRHEFGHHIWENFLTEQDRQEWEIIYEKTNNEKFITDYASISANEDFAENMMYYFSNQNFYIKCYFGYCSNSIYKKISKERLNLIIENVIMKYEPEKIDEVLYYL